MTQTIEDRIREMLKHTVIGVRGYPVKKIGILTEWEGKTSMDSTWMLMNRFKSASLDSTWSRETR